MPSMIPCALRTAFPLPGHARARGFSTGLLPWLPGAADLPATLMLLLFALAPTTGRAATWELDAGRSELTFVGTQQSAPFTGRFETFTTEIDFDPAAPGEGRIAARVDVRSARTDNGERDQYLQTRDFFYSRKYPEAVFETTAIRAAEAPGEYVAPARLTLRGETREVTLRMRFEAGTPGRLRGTVRLERLDFGVGQGEWRDTQAIGNEVTVKIDLTLDPAGQ